PTPLNSIDTPTNGDSVDLSNWEEDWSKTWQDISFATSPEGKQYRIEIDPSNFGDRHAKDAKGNPAQNDILVVLHETTSSAESAIHTFQTHHPDDSNQVSYHALILRDGRIIHLVPPEKRAYGAGNSEFRSDQGVEAVQTNSKYPSSVNNFAYHISLETPPEAFEKDVAEHSGYESMQYESLAWLIRQLQVPASRVTTHQAIDRNFDRFDPRSFDMEYLATCSTRRR
ncbi:MAG: N-acetylmuramoyl-L-alanine amidase, partial [Acaryochloridaceae cyanobacterium RL_2_7]|nr:N-acetylmuramoyl-L-alanine amidase [Acaryochloridaceae cyanobacterium RL_2_7]